MCCPVQSPAAGGFSSFLAGSQYSSFYGEENQGSDMVDQAGGFAAIPEQDEDSDEDTEEDDYSLA